MLARFVVNSHVKHHPNRDEDAADDDGLMVCYMPRFGDMYLVCK